MGHSHFSRYRYRYFLRPCGSLKKLREDITGVQLSPPLPVQLVQPLLTAARLEYRTMDTMLKIGSVEGSHGIIYKWRILHVNFLHTLIRIPFQENKGPKQRQGFQQGSHRSGKSQDKRLFLKSQENLILVRTIQNLANGQEKMEQDSKNFRLHLWLWQPSVMYEQFLIG